MSDREDALNALFALGQTITWDTPARGFRMSSRRLKNFADLPAQPAFFQFEPTESFTQKTNLASIRTLEIWWIIYHQDGASATAVPTTTNSLILDAVEAALAPDDFSDRCTLGGLAHHCWIEGQVFRDPGDTDNQAMVAVPVRVLLP